MQYTGNTLTNYMYSAVFGDIKIAAYATIASAPFMPLIFIFGSKLADKFGLEKMIRTCLLISSAMYISLFGLHAMFNVNPWVHILWSGIAMGLATISIYMQWGLVGEAIDYNEMITGKRTEGSIYGTFNLSRRVGQTIGNSSAVILLGLVGYNADLAVQTATTVFGIKALCVLLPGIFVLGSWAAFKFMWNMDKETRDKLAAFKAGK
jgi:GPH family glycoside/pentoside/hexuronide:cation symporter